MEVDEINNSEYEFVPENLRKEQFIFAGRLERLKGIDFLLKTWRHMKTGNPKLIICGTGPMEEWCKEFVDKYQLNVEILGIISNKEVRHLIANSKALILPTKWYEGFPMSIIEAFSVGTPALCSGIGNLDCIVKEGVNGYKFKNDDIEGLLNAIKKCSGIYESTFVEYKKNYTELKNYEQLLKIYERVTRNVI